MLSLGTSDFSVCSGSMRRPAWADFRRMGERGVGAPFPPSFGLSKHPPSVHKSSNWSRNKSLICDMCSGPPRYYNPIYRQAGYPLNHPPPRAARLFCCLCRRVGNLWAVGTLTHTRSFSRAAVVARNGRLATPYAPEYVEVISANFVSWVLSEVRQKGPKMWPPGRCAEFRNCPIES